MLRTVSDQLIAVERLSSWDLVSHLELQNPDLAAKLQEFLVYDQDYNFYKASYPFGARIIENGKCYLPLNDGKSIAMDDPDLPESILADLKYDSDVEDPLAIMLNKISEFYLSTHGRTHPHSLITQGQMFGIPRAVDNTNNIPVSALGLNLNAGARSLFILSSISDKIFHSRLQDHYGITHDAPASLTDHWQIFVELAKLAQSPWRTEIIYFPRNFINKLKDVKYAELTNCLMQLHRASYNIWHNVSSVWNNAFYEIEQAQHLTNYPMYSLTTAKHMYILAANSAPGFKPATNDMSAPISLITDAYINIYKITQKNNNAVIMEPGKFNIHQGDAIYYSLNHPTFVQNNLEVSRKKSQISLLEEVRWINDVYLKAILTSANHIKSLYDVANNTQFSYYHSTPQGYKNILDAALIAKEDLRFVRGRDGAFPNNSQFFKGCIKISRKV